MTRRRHKDRLTRTRSILLHGLGIALRRFPAFLWTYAFGLLLAIVFSLPLYSQLSSALDHSLTAQRLSAGFDVGTVISATSRIHEGGTGQTITPSSAKIGQVSILFYFLLYFLLIPGTLFCYISRSPARLSTLLQQGVLHFWRFFRITVLAAIAGVFILGPLAVLQTRWAGFVDDRFVGRTAFLLTLAGLLVVLLAASLLRLYFDLVEAYTVQLGTDLLPSGSPDRRVRRALRPAFHTLRENFLRSWLVFLFLAILGCVAVFFSGRAAIHMLAQPRVWPMFFTAQLGLFLMLFTRFWQRGAEVSLVSQHPILADHDARDFAPVPPPPPYEHQPPLDMIYNSDPLTPLYPAPLSPDDPISPLVPPEPRTTPADPIPDPEPASPSLDEPDPGVFHHEPKPPQPPVNPDRQA
jgi:hypothetical protein